MGTIAAAIRTTPPVDASDEVQIGLDAQLIFAALKRCEDTLEPRPGGGFHEDDITFEMVHPVSGKRWLFFPHDRFDAAINHMLRLEIVICRSADDLDEPLNYFTVRKGVYGV